MRKEASFDSHWGDGWPDPQHVKKCLLDPTLRGALFARGRDGGSFSIVGLYGTEGLPARGGLVTVSLYMYFSPEHGMTLQYYKWDGRIQQGASFSSRGSLNRLGQFVRSQHGTPLSLGLFIGFEQGTAAVMQFMESNGNLPTAIAWIGDKDLPPETFPDPYPPKRDGSSA